MLVGFSVSTLVEFVVLFSEMFVGERIMTTMLLVIKLFLLNVLY